MVMMVVITDKSGERCSPDTFSKGAKTIPVLDPANWFRAFSNLPHVLEVDMQDA
jgi:hypothetical protein